VGILRQRLDHFEYDVLHSLYSILTSVTVHAKISESEIYSKRIAYVNLL